jgi:hypothetical protein
LKTTAPQHPGACELAVAVREARPRRRENVLIDWIRQHRQDWKELGLPPEFRVPPARQADPAVRDSIARGERVAIDTTPTLFINGVRVRQILPAQGLDWAIRLELERARSKPPK